MSGDLLGLPEAGADPAAWFAGLAGSRWLCRGTILIFISCCFWLNLTLMHCFSSVVVFNVSALF